MGCNIVHRPRGTFSVKRKVRSVNDVKIEPATFVHKNTQKFQEVYRLGARINLSSSGEVRVCIHRDTGQSRAVKIFKKDFLEISSIQTFENEIGIFKQLDHPNIVRMHEFFNDDKKMCIVMELCSGGELFQEIIKRVTFTEIHAAQIMQQLLSAVAYLQDNRIVHRDIKPQNILLEEHNEVLNIKLVDFGKSVLSSQSYRLLGNENTLYTSPELSRGEFDDTCDL